MVFLVRWILLSWFILAFYLDIITTSASRQCLGAWPQFENQTDVSAHPFGDYVKAIYGSIPTDPQGALNIYKHK